MTHLQKKTIFIGIITIITISAAVVGFEFLKGNNPLKKDKIFYVVYDNIYNLTETAPVYISGKKIGQVMDIHFINSQDYNKILVTLFIEENIKIPKHSIAQISTTDLLGSKGITILPNQNSNQWANPGDTLIGKVEIPIQELIIQQLIPLQNTINQINNLLYKINNTFDTTTSLKIKNAVNNLNNILFSLDTMLGQQSQIQKTIQHVSSFSQKLNSQSDTLANIINSTNEILKSINDSDIKHTLSQLDSIATNLNNITGHIKNGNGTLGKIYYSDSLYNQLDSVTRQLNKLLNDIQQHPSKYINIKVF